LYEFRVLVDLQILVHLAFCARIRILVVLVSVPAVFSLVTQRFQLGGGDGCLYDCPPTLLKVKPRDLTVRSLPRLPYFLFYSFYSQWRGERYDGTSSRTGPHRPRKMKKNVFVYLKDTAKNEF